MCQCNATFPYAEDLIDLTAATRPVPEGTCVMCEVARAHPRTKMCHGCEIRLAQMAEAAGEPAEYPTPYQYRSVGAVAANAPEEYDMIDLGLYGQWLDADPVDVPITHLWDVPDAA